MLFGNNKNGKLLFAGNNVKTVLPECKAQVFAVVDISHFKVDRNRQRITGLIKHYRH